MWRTFSSLWFALSGKLKREAAPRRRASFRRRSFRPRLEALEDRTAPASLGYSTLLGGTVYASAVDSAGDVYVTGAAGPGLATTPGAFQTSGSGAFVAKLNPTGTVLYLTYLGNAGTNYYYSPGLGIAVDSAGDAYVIGRSSNVPTTANAIASSGSGQDFVAELNPTGSTLLYATYLPGTLNFGFTLGFSGAIAVDSAGNIDVAGAAGPGLPVTPGAFQTAYLGGTGGNNAFFAKINPTLSGSASLLYVTYLGGSGGDDQASGIALDPSGNAYVTGFTYSTNFPTTSGAFQPTYSGGGGDAFVAKFNPALSGAASLVYSTYLGGSGLDGYQVPTGGAVEMAQINGAIAVDSAGDAYVTGSTSSSNFPTTPGAFQVHSSFGKNGGYGSPSDAFVTKLNATGTALVYSTYLGGGSKSQSLGTSIALDANGDAYLTGWTNSTSFPTQNPLQAANSGGYDAFVTALNPSGSGLLFSSYLGATGGVSGGDGGGSIALDPQGNVYVAVTGGPVDKITPVAPVPSLPSLSVTGFPSSPTAGVAYTFIVTARDANGNVLTGYTGTVHFTNSDRSATLPADYTFTAADQGVHTFSATLFRAGSQSIAATDVAHGVSGSELVTVAPAAASTLVLAAYPSPTDAGFAGNFTVTALDPYGNVASGYTGTVQFSSSDGSAAVPAPYTFTAADAGAHTFSATLNTTGTQSLTAMDTGNSSITGTQANITVAPAGLAALGVTGFPSATTAGASQTITVTARLANGSIDTGYLGTVHFTSSDSQAILPADYTFTAADQGVHTFSVMLKTAGSQSITATDTVFGSITGSDAGIVVSPAAASKFVLNLPGGGDVMQSGAPFTLMVTVEDAYGNVVPTYTGTVRFSGGTPQETLPPDYTFTAADAGVHTFINAFVLVMPRRGPQGAWIVQATDTQNSSVTGQIWLYF
jgi:hypothetical protein